jgi:predicted transposase YbfD/YdcC
MEEEVADFFWQVTDYRVEGRCLHELSDIIWLVLCGLLADCEDFEQIYDYACDKQAVLAQFLSLPAGIPSSYTLQRVFSRLNPVELEASLTHWGQDILRVLAGQQLAIDGKQVRGTCLPGQRQASVQLVSVWATTQRLCLAQTQVASKANELVAIPQVLDLVEVAGSVVSIDAIGCQRAIATTLVERRADYVLALKQNQQKLFEQVQAHLAPLLRQEPAFVSREKDHGRGEERRVWVSRDLNLVEEAAEWAGLAAVVCVQTRRWQQGREQQSTRYYLTSLAQASAGELAGYVRGHWGIENDLHWHLDVTFAEDACRVRQGHAPRNLSTLRKLALTLLRREPTKMSLPRKRKKAARDDDYLRQLLKQLDPNSPDAN